MDINLYSYLRPPSKLVQLFNQIPNLNSYNQRIIFGNQNTYDSNQLEGVNKIYQYLKKRRPDKEYPKEVLLKMYHLGNFDVQNSISKLAIYDQWHDQQILVRQKITNIIQAGVFYQYGKDQNYHPVIYFRPNRIELNTKPNYFTVDDYYHALKVFLDVIQQYMMVPGVVETWILVVDFQNQKVNISVDIAKKSIQKIAIAYPFRLKHLFLMNVTKQVLPYISNLAQSVPKKILDLSPPKALTINSNNQLTNYIPAHERQKKYGGELRDKVDYWPISITYRHQEYSENMMQRQQQTEFESIMNEADFEIDKNLQGQGLCGGGCNSCKII